MSKLLKIGAPILLLFLVSLASLFPLRMAMVLGKPSGFTYQRVEGTVWNGMFHYPRLGGLETASLAVALSPAGLLTGKAVTDFRLTGDILSGTGALSLSGNRMQLHEAGFDVNIDTQAGFVRFRGSLYLSIDRLTMTDTGCEEIDGLFRTDLLTPLKNMGLWSEAEASGALACDKGRVNIVLNDGKGEEQRRVSVTFDPLQMRLDTDISVKTASAELVAKLTQAGFRKRNDRWVWHHQERIG